MNSKISQTVYEPQEDSFLLAEQVRKYSKGRVLDMGTGSGIQGDTAKRNKNVTSVAYADINPEVKVGIRDAIITNLFNSIKGRYNTIIFNPPYLPEDRFDNEKAITTGGKIGHEIIERFLKQAKNHIEPEGIILILFSSLTGKDRIDRIITNLHYNKKELSKKSLFMEQLYVYKITNNTSIITGHRGVVEVKTIVHNGKKIKVAIKHKKNQFYNPEIESEFLKVMNRWGIGPKLIVSDKSSISMEYIEGERIIDYMHDHDKKQVLLILGKIIDQLRVMDNLNINKLELTNPYKHIIIKKSEPIQIDFERCQYTEKPKNITQFVQFLVSGKIQYIFNEKSIRLDKDKMLDIAKDYKKDYDEKYVKELIRCIK